MFELTMKNEGIIYECKRCGGSMSAYNIEERGGEVKCIHCGYRILKKIKPPVVKRIRAI